jgi:hypothetical protein
VTELEGVAYVLRREGTVRRYGVRYTISVSGVLQAYGVGCDSIVSDISCHSKLVAAHTALSKDKNSRSTK